MRSEFHGAFPIHLLSYKKDKETKLPDMKIVFNSFRRATLFVATDCFIIGS